MGLSRAWKLQGSNTCATSIRPAGMHTVAFRRRWEMHRREFAAVALHCATNDAARSSAAHCLALGWRERTTPRSRIHVITHIARAIVAPALSRFVRRIRHARARLRTTPVERLSRTRKKFREAATFTSHERRAARLVGWQDAEPRIDHRQGLRPTGASVASNTRPNRPQRREAGVRMRRQDGGS